MLQRLIATVLSAPKAILLAVLLATAAMIVPTKMIRVESDVDAFIPVGDDVLVNLQILEEVFGNSLLTMILIMREDHPDGIYNPQTLDVIADITDWLRTRPEFETDTNADLRSLASVNDIRGDNDDMIVEPFWEGAVADQDQAQRIREAIESNGIYVGSLAATDGKGAAILVRNSDLSLHDLKGTADALQGYLGSLKEAGHPEKFHITGRPIVEGLFSTFIPEEGRRLIPWVLALIAAFLALTFGTVRGVLIPLSVIVGTEIWMLGFQGLWGHPFYTITSILPVLVIAVSVADAVHLMAKYYEVQRTTPEATRAQVVQATLADMARPVFLTSVTTAVGFLSMAASPITPIHDFGITMTAGIIAAWFLSVVYIPAVLAILPLRPQRTSWLSLGAPGGGGVVGLLLERSTRFATERPWRVLAGFTSILVFFAFGLLFLRTDSSQISQFRPGHEIRIADGIANQHFAGGTMFDIVIDGKTEGAIKDPHFLQRLAALQEKLEEDPDVGDTMSIAEMIQRMNRIMNGDDPKQERIPDSQELVAQYLLLYSISGDVGDFEDLIDYDDRYAHMLVFLTNPGTSVAREAVSRAQTLIAELFPSEEGFSQEFRFTGPAYTIARLEHYIVEGQVSTLVICIPILILLNSLTFRSLWFGFFSVLPVISTVLIAYGGMGWVGLPTDVASLMLGSMTLGIGVDFAIHWLHKYRQLRSLAGATSAAACLDTARSAGYALLVNMMVLAGGFLVMLSARFYPQVKLGALVSLTMVVCYFATMYLFPALLTVSEKKQQSG